ncbi:hypothetical protein M5K25_021500 [Dendrobium thyrsiflorum]|uniref:Uncharacterized protein n=1 Tax=Dendrobium thyrsiflorum TaxID=117978 RepID=A0ABD0UCJ9_DENTH
MTSTNKSATFINTKNLQNISLTNLIYKTTPRKPYRKATIKQNIKIPLINPKQINPSKNIRKARYIHPTFTQHHARRVRLHHNPIRQHIHRDIHPQRPPRPHPPFRRVSHADDLPSVVEIGGAVTKPEGRGVGILDGDIGGESGVERKGVGEGGDEAGDEEAVDVEGSVKARIRMTRPARRTVAARIPERYRVKRINEMTATMKAKRKVITDLIELRSE